MEYRVAVAVIQDGAAVSSGAFSRCGQEAVRLMTVDVLTGERGDRNCMIMIRPGVLSSNKSTNISFRIVRCRNRFVVM
jgi:hypothetical protein